MVISEEFPKEWNNLTSTGEYAKAIGLIDVELKSKQDNDSKSELLTLKGKTLSMLAYNTKPGEVRKTTGPPPTYSYDYQLLAEAITCFDKSIELKPDNKFAYENKALTLARKGNFKEAIKCGKASLDINPKNFVILSNLSKWYKDMEDYKESITFADKVIQNKNMASKKELFSAYFNKSISQLNLKQRDCIHSMESAIELESDPEKKEDYLKDLQEMKEELNSK